MIFGRVVRLSWLIVLAGCFAEESPEYSGAAGLDLESEEGRLSALVRASILATHVFAFDDIADPSEDQSLNVFSPECQREFDLVAIEVSRRLAAGHEKENLLCLDGIHMKEPYHRIMSKEWLKFLIGARPAAELL
jgi:hypothetical protein